jgi:hypothetical protein
LCTRTPSVTGLLPPVGSSFVEKGGVRILEIIIHVVVIVVVVVLVVVLVLSEEITL